MNDLPEAPESETMTAALTGDQTAGSAALFAPDELNIYVNKITLEAYIFHAKPVAQDIDRLEYDSADHSVTVIKKDGTRLDLGVKIEWLIRSYFVQAKEVAIAQTKDGEVVDGFTVPLTHKPQK